MRENVDFIQSSKPKIKTISACELKKQNSNVAIVSKLKQMSQRKKSAEVFLTSKTSNTFKSAATTCFDDPAEIFKLSETEIGDSDSTVNIVSYLKQSDKVTKYLTQSFVQISKETKIEKPVTRLKRKCSNQANEVEAKFKRLARKVNPSHEMVSTSCTSDVHGSTVTLNSNAVRTEDTRNNSAAAKYVYEIVCNRVGNHVTASDLVSLPVLLRFKQNTLITPYLLAKISAEGVKSEWSEEQSG